MNKKKIGVGIVGAGAIANNFHIPAWYKIKNTKIMEVFDIDLKKSKKIAKKYQIEKISISYEAMLRNKEIDIIAILTPNTLHASQAIKAIKKGKHVIIEKPFATSYKDALKIKNIAKKMGVVVMCAQHQRFRPSSYTSIDLIDKNKIGKIYYAKATAIETRHIQSHTNSFIDKKLSGGGCLLDIGVHILDVAWWMMGAPEPTSVSGKCFYNLSKQKNITNKLIGNKKLQCEESAVALIKFKNGSTLSLETSYLLNNDKSEFEFRLYGNKGGLIWPDVRLIEEKKTGLCIKKIKNRNNNLASIDQLNHFIGCIKKNKKPLVSIDESVTVIKIIDAIYKSSKTGREVNL